MTIAVKVEAVGSIPLEVNIYMINLNVSTRVMDVRYKYVCLLCSTHGSSM